METLIPGSFTKSHTWKMAEQQFQPAWGIHRAHCQNSTGVSSQWNPSLFPGNAVHLCVFPWVSLNHPLLPLSIPPFPSFPQNFGTIRDLQLWHHCHLVFVFFLLLLLSSSSFSPLIPIPSPSFPSSSSFFLFKFLWTYIFPLINLIQLSCRSHWRNEKLVFKLLCIQQGNEHLELLVVEAERQGRPVDSSTRKSYSIFTKLRYLEKEAWFHIFFKLPWGFWKLGINRLYNFRGFDLCFGS